MAIDRIPGVGPTNADIATAVAAPSAATIAAAVAAPSAASIASAVAAPSSATIASAVAAAVPTLSQINTSVANNASPYGGTWTNIAQSLTNNSINTVTLSNLGGYKYLRLHAYITSFGGPDSLSVRLNGDSGGNYMYASTGLSGNAAAAAGNQFLINASSTQRVHLVMDIENATSATAHKNITGRGSNNNGAGFGPIWFDGLYTSNSPITSITVFSASGNLFSNTTNIYVRGAN
jgi:hypothetical protein